jgi:hypothetical protein
MNYTETNRLSRLTAILIQIQTKRIVTDSKTPTFHILTKILILILKNSTNRIIFLWTYTFYDIGIKTNSKNLEVILFY